MIGLLVITASGNDRSDEQDEQEDKSKDQAVVLSTGQTNALHEQSSGLRQPLLLRYLVARLKHLDKQTNK